jgi:molecular chaperone Hsp33
MTTTDTLHRFLFDDLHVRGELVQLQQCVQQVMAGHNYPEGVQALLAELMAATCLLTATLKFEGEITVQLQGDGPVAYMAINGDHQQKMRGIARLTSNTNAHGLNELIGKGTMVITIRPKQGEAYQGIVALNKPTIAGCLMHYFETSEQIPTKIWLYTQHSPLKVGGMLLQLLPDSGDKSEQLADLAHLSHLTDTLTKTELFSLPAEQILHRLYHEETVKLFEPQQVKFECTCSADKCLTAISQIDSKEIEAILEEQGVISMHCDYCQTDYRFTADDLKHFKH